MNRARKFDWDEAARLRELGLSYAEIGRRLGVSDTAVYYVLNPEARAQVSARDAEWRRAGTCPDCGGPATRLGGGRQNRCRACADRARTLIRDGERRCSTCKQWLPLALFARSSWRKHGYHGQCRACNTEAKRVWRARQKAAA